MTVRELLSKVPLRQPFPLDSLKTLPSVLVGERECAAINNLGGRRSGYRRIRMDGRSRHIRHACHSVDTFMRASCALWVSTCTASCSGDTPTLKIGYRSRDRYRQPAAAGHRGCGNLPPPRHVFAAYSKTLAFFASFFSRSRVKAHSASSASLRSSLSLPTSRISRSRLSRISSL